MTTPDFSVPHAGASPEARPPRACDYFGGCWNAAKYLVEYTTPDDGKAMRKRMSAERCFWHRDEKWFPKGATQIVWSNLNT